jgi:hypothetical protein
MTKGFDKGAKKQASKQKKTTYRGCPYYTGINTSGTNSKHHVFMWSDQEKRPTLFLPSWSWFLLDSVFFSTPSPGIDDRLGGNGGRYRPGNSGYVNFASLVGSDRGSLGSDQGCPYYTGINTSSTNSKHHVFMWSDQELRPAPFLPSWSWFLIRDLVLLFAYSVDLELVPLVLIPM